MTVFAQRIRALMTISGLVSTGIVSLLLVVGAGLALRLVEPGLELSVFDSIWWSISTATTVGYGDIIPITVGGRVIAALVMLLGVGFVSILTGAMARVFFMPEAELIEQEEDLILAELRAVAARLDSLEQKLAERS